MSSNDLDHPDRQALLRNLRDALAVDDLPSTVCSCLWLSDVEKLSELVVMIQNMPQHTRMTFIDGLNTTRLVDTWLTRAKERKSDDSTPGQTSPFADSPGPSKPPRREGQSSPVDIRSVPSSPLSATPGGLRRSAKAKANCITRDRGICVVTHAEMHNDVPHIFPFSLGKKDGDFSSRRFWDILRTFWSEEKVKAWHLDAVGTSKKTEQSHNLLCMAPTAHVYWDNYRFALKPIELSKDRKSLTVQFYWMPIHDRRARMPILERPSLPDDLLACGPLKLYDQTTDKRITSGDRIVLTTRDPDSLPLPSVALLEMQWVLQRIAAMCGGAEVEDDYHFSDNDGDDDALDVQGEDPEEATEEASEGNIHPLVSAENPRTPKHAEDPVTAPPLAIRNPNIQRWGQ